MPDFEQQIDLFEASMAIACALLRSSRAAGTAKEIADFSFETAKHMAINCQVDVKQSMTHEALDFIDNKWDQQTPCEDDVGLMESDLIGGLHDNPTTDETERISRARRHFAALAKQAGREDLAEFFNPGKQ